ncbi:hypothetical protein [uncultured Microbulbifer sp.]|uniref:hypothetical protein n=1 Tax=uncultured Microbulbifer sp. TaxID=348147 RepID=UPI002626E951|nr:hypothetical protein [uncultured Microbulbifer sp.]
MNCNRKQPNPAPQPPTTPGFFLLMVAAESPSIRLARQILNHTSSPTANMSPEGHALGTGQ